MTRKTGGLLVILEDDKEEIRKLFIRCESLGAKFTRTIEIPVFTNKELVAFGESYAQERDCVLDEMAVLALYNRIGNNQTSDHLVNVAEVKEMVDEAIEKRVKQVAADRVDAEAATGGKAEGSKMAEAVAAAEKGASLAALAQIFCGCGGAETSVPALGIHRAVEHYEALRAASEKFKAEKGFAPKLFLATMGPLLQHKARADFIRGFFEVGGFDVIYPNGFQTPEEAAKAPANMKMADATGSTATVRLSAQAGTYGEAVFQSSGTVIEFPGFMKATGTRSAETAQTTQSDRASKPADADENASLPPLKPGDALSAADVQADGHETQPPARYTEASLVRTLEAKEIGRPSTYASIISTIIDRGYVYERGRALIPSWLAFAVTKLLETKFPKYVDYQFTADMENGLDQIAHGKESGRDWLTRFYFGSGDGAAANADEAHAGLQQQVAQLGEIDARAINTIEIGDGLHVRVGRYGPYLEDMNHLDDQGNPKRASLPQRFVEIGHELIEKNAGGPRELGKDPATGGTVEVRSGRFGPYVALIAPEQPASAAEEDEGAKPAKRGTRKAAAAPRPKMASLFKTMTPETLTLEDALKLLSLPREVGTLEEANAETGELSQAVITANNGRYGPYLTKTGADGKTETRSLGSEDEIFTVDLEKAKELFAQPKYGRGRGRGAAKPPLRELGPDPETGKPVTIKDGFYGAYITDGETNRTLPKQYTPESIEPAEAFRLLAEKRAAGPAKRRTRRTTSSKSTKSSTAKKTATRKTTAKKSTAAKTKAE